MVYEVKDKVFFITGAASGIGALVVRILVEEGAKFIVIFDVNKKDGVALRTELNSKYGEKVKFIKGDVTNEDQFIGSLRSVKAEIGLDVLINNAGIMNDGINAYRKEIEINVTALVTGTIKALELMRKDEGGSGGTIINISSVAGLCQDPVMPVYWATKSAVLQFSNCIGLNDYYSRTGVRVIALCYGKTETALIHNVNSFDKHIESTFPERFSEYPSQQADAAARGLVDAYKQASSGTTWLSTSGRPVEDISADIKEAYDIMSKRIYE
ncbi:15-hydroxyprostaglandin dehydrogenase [NAD(+)]-like [Ostrinia furnacalis]|uniref:15-hydroxyprostaglandin dehydrogenase [NAD(+)]-like n=1 Tax=Ostrinia furnacalis TaxID=93504 RepID=UPI00103AD11F|nr:15-hydroxyprostaglandin dehydrogenase [NAD(+)]-like [Ostrinia furnacalis]